MQEPKTKEKRTHEIKIRVTDFEFRQMQKRKTKNQLATWLRELALGEKPKKPIKTIDPNLLFELNRIGVNINQIARRCNQQSPNIDLLNISIALQDIDQELKQVMRIAE